MKYMVKLRREMTNKIIKVIIDGEDFSDSFVPTKRYDDVTIEPGILTGCPTA